jgi:hypothetical protein
MWTVQVGIDLIKLLDEGDYETVRQFVDAHEDAVKTKLTVDTAADHHNGEETWFEAEVGPFDDAVSYAAALPALSGAFVVVSWSAMMEQEPVTPPEGADRALIEAGFVRPDESPYWRRDPKEES